MGIETLVYAVGANILDTSDLGCNANTSELFNKGFIYGTLVFNSAYIKRIGRITNMTLVPKIKVQYYYNLHDNL